MNIYKLLKDFGNEELLNKKTSRRNSLRQFTGLGKDIAKAAIPLGLATAAGTKSSFAAASMQMPTPIEVLNFALFLEYLERNYYQMGMDSGVVPSEDEATYMQILQHEADHVTFLMNGISGAGGTPIEEPDFDFTAGGTFDPFNDYPTYLALSQAFEDTGVRAYKGQAANLMSNGDLLQAALQIHSVEARHASQVRRIRDQKGWITQSQYDSGIPAAAGDAVYGGATPESNTVQGGVDLSGMFGGFGGDDAVTESYDEPLTMQEVQDIASLFTT